MPGLTARASLSWAEPMNLPFSTQVGFAPSVPSANAQANEIYLPARSQRPLKVPEQDFAKTADIPRLSMLVWACPDQGHSHCH